jgi:GTP-binding protein
MKRIPAEFIRAAMEPVHYPPAGLPEVAFAGRSNVGKSSLINALLGSGKLAKTSRHPGRTQQLIFFRVDDRFIFVDLPGYGFARVSASMRRQWKDMVEAYLANRPSLGFVILVLDIRRDLSTDDLSLVEWLSSRDIPILPVATKIDKLSKREVLARAGVIKKQIGLPGEASLLLFSAETGEGRDELWREVQRLEHAFGNDSRHIKQKT